MKFVGLFLLCLVVSYYSYNYPTIRNYDNTFLVKGVLIKSPEYKDMGENPNLISIYLKDYKKHFNISGCGLSAVNKTMLLGMQTNEKIWLLVDKDDLKKAKSFMDKTVYVLEVEIPGKSKILTIDQINHCERKSWKVTLWLSSIIGIGLLIFLIKRIITYR